MKTTIVLHDVYCDVTYPEYLLRPQSILQKPYVSVKGNEHRFKSLYKWESVN